MMKCLCTDGADLFKNICPASVAIPPPKPVAPKACPGAAKDFCKTSPGKAPASDTKCTEICRKRGTQVMDDQCYGGQDGNPIMLKCQCTDGADEFSKICPATQALRGAVAIA